MMGSEHPQPDTADTWRQQAACRNVNPNLMFPNDWDEDGIAAAKALCRACPVQDQCLTFALDNREDHGIWGGATERERSKIRRRRGQKARPPRPLAPINHGTDGGYRAHLRRNEKPCAACAAAHREYLIRYREQNPDTRRGEARALSGSARRVLNDLATTPRHAADLHSQILASLTNRGLVTIDADGMAHATDTAQQVAS